MFAKSKCSFSLSPSLLPSSLPPSSSPCPSTASSFCYIFVPRKIRFRCDPSLRKSVGISS
ncbi:hypothetical protein E2C01_037829 [Portunus trituberculatus]|uniref:Uncharacterized protein n=1 Tax=Portunus trituberculatus TaxID=210409 RepID=A0A5B7FF32_PORTR|nr:hypothetical protein [Portunus trituberculatus]